MHERIIQFREASSSLLKNLFQSLRSINLRGLDKEVLSVREGTLGERHLRWSLSNDRISWFQQLLTSALCKQVAEVAEPGSWVAHFPWSAEWHCEARYKYDS